MQRPQLSIHQANRSVPNHHPHHPHQPRDYTTICAVLGRHDIKPEALARRAGMSPGHLTRVMNGQHPVTAHAVRCLYQMTGDPELIAYIAPDQSWVAVSILNKDADPLPAMMTLASDLAKSAGLSDQHIANIDGVLQALAAYRHRLMSERASAPTNHFEQSA